MFRIGDKVKIHKPKDISEWPTWTSDMDTFDNKVGTVTAVMSFNSNRHYCHIDYESCAFDINWLEKIENQQLDSINPGDCVIIHKPKDPNENKESEGNKMNFSNILNVEFGKINDSHDVAASMYGIAIRGNDNRYRAYDKANYNVR